MAIENSHPGARSATPSPRLSERLHLAARLIARFAARPDAPDLRVDMNPRPEAPPRSPEATPRSPEAPARLDVESDASEACFQATLGAGARVVAFVGAKPGAGASVCARALAERSARAGRKTLLIDASSANDPAYFRQPQAVGAASCARSGASSPQPCVGCPTLSWCAGDETPPPNLDWRRLYGEDDRLRLRDQAVLRKLWIEKFADWEAIVLDCSPAVANDVEGVPGHLVAQSADAVLIVAPSGGVTREEIVAARNLLRGANLVGVVVNGRDQPSVGAEMAAASEHTFGYFPQLARGLAARLMRSSWLNVQS